MKNFIQQFVAIIVITIAMALFSTANAEKAEKFMQSLQAYAKLNGTNIEYERITEGPANTYVIDNMSYTLLQKNQDINIKKVTISGAQYVSDDDFSFERLLAEGLTMNVQTSNGFPGIITIEEFETSAFENKNIDGQNGNVIRNMELREIEVKIDREKNEVSFQFPSLVFEDIIKYKNKQSSINNVKLAPGFGVFKDKKTQGQIKFDGIIAEGIRVLSGGETVIDNMNVKPLTISVTDTGKPFELIFEGANVENYFATNFLSENSQLFGDKEISVELLPMNLDVAGKSVFGWKGGYYKSAANDNKTTNEVFSGINGIFINFKNFDLNPTQAAQLKQMFALGYEQLVMDMSLNSIWDTNTGLMDLSKYGIKIYDVGVFDANLKIGGMTPKLLSSIYQELQTINKLKTKKEKNTAPLRLLPLIGPMTLNEYSLSIKDDSLLNKLVDLQSQRTGQPPEQIKGIAGPMVSISLLPFNIPALAESASNAVTSFMDGNKTITISMQPETPLSFLELFSLSQQVQQKQITPEALANKLNVSVDAK